MARRKTRTVLRSVRVTADTLETHIRHAESLVTVTWKVVAGPPNTPTIMTSKEDPLTLHRYGIR